MNSSQKKTLIIATLLVVFAVLGRLLPHAWNATPIIAVSLIAGMYLGHKYALGIPIVAMLISDGFIGFYDPKVMMAVYGSLALAGVIGFALKKKKLVHLLGGAIGASVLFFLVTNFAVWAFGTMYPPTLSGLMSSYTMAIPFFKNMFIGDLFYSVLLFGAFEFSRVYARSRVHRRIRSGEQYTQITM